MKLVIDIPDKDYEFIKDLRLCNLGRRWGNTIEQNVINAIKKGTPYEERPIEPKRKFIRIITTYHPDDIVCYKEYKGKPYFSIEYQENGETIEGYGTYNPDVLSRFLRDYFFNER